MKTQVRLILAGSIAALRAFAVDTLPETVVTARPETPTSPALEDVRKQLQTVPGATALIDAESYKTGRAANIKDALDFAPGIYVQPRFGSDESRISIRGSGLQRTFHGRGLMLLQDGVPLNLADGAFDFQAVEALSARAVEVYRGANALQFGSTTLGGAINFLSPTGLTASPLTLRSEFGSFDSFRAQAASGMTMGAADAYVSLTHSSQDGFREHSQQNTLRIFSNLGYQLSPEWETRFFLTYVHSDSELPGAITKAQIQNDPRVAQRNPFFPPVDVVLSNWKRDFDLLRLANQTAWVSGDQSLTISSFWSHKNLDHPILFWIDQSSNDLGTDLRYDNKADWLGHKNQFTIGFYPTWGALHDQRFANNLGQRGGPLDPSPFGTSAPSDNQQTALNLNLYTQNRFYFLPEWAVVAGAQLSYAQRRNHDRFPISALNPDNSDRQDWWGFSPKLGLLWEPTTDIQGFLNVSRSFEPPSFGELVNANNNAPGLLQLDAQTATTLELGTRGKHGPWQWDLALYHAWIDNELLESQIAPGLNQTTNAGRTIHQGIEAALDLELAQGILHPATTSASTAARGKDGKSLASDDPTAKADRLVLRQTYLWNHFHFDGDSRFGNNALAGIPEHYYRAELLYQHPNGFYAGPNVEWVPQGYAVDFADTLHTDPYALLGFKVGVRKPTGWSFYLEAKNLTDRKYTATTNVIANAGGADSQQFYPGDGRSFFLGVEWNW